MTNTTELGQIAAVGAAQMEAAQRPEEPNVQLNEDLRRLTAGDYGPRLPYEVWKGLDGFECRDQFFQAWHFEIGQAGSYVRRMVEDMMSGKAEERE